MTDEFEYLFEKLWDDEGEQIVAGDTVCLNGEQTEVGRTHEGMLFFMMEPADGMIHSLRLGPCDKRGRGDDDHNSKATSNTARKERLVN